MNATPTAAGKVHDPRRDAWSAWLSLLLYPVSLVAAFLVGEGLATWLFGWPDENDPALWEVLVSSVPALAVFALPAVVAWHFGMRAALHGARSGRVAALVAVAVAVMFVIQNVLAYVFG
jgi:hypothetical protein